MTIVVRKISWKTKVWPDGANLKPEHSLISYDLVEPVVQEAKEKRKLAFITTLKINKNASKYHYITEIALTVYQPKQHCHS
jgi:hypothetical protein